MAASKPEFEVEGYSEPCPAELAIDLVSGRWKTLIIHKLLDGKMRYGEIKKRIPGINDKMLTEQLRKLEEDRLVARHVYASVPPKVEYELTPLGEELRVTFGHLADWGRRFLRGTDKQPGKRSDKEEGNQSEA